MTLDSYGGLGERTNFDVVWPFLQLRTVRRVEVDGLDDRTRSDFFHGGRRHPRFGVSHLVIKNSVLEAGKIRKLLANCSSLKEFTYQDLWTVMDGHDKCILPAVRKGLEHLEDSLEALSLSNVKFNWDATVAEYGFETLGSLAAFRRLR